MAEDDRMTSQGITEADAGILPADRVQPEPAPVVSRSRVAAPIRALVSA